MKKRNPALVIVLAVLACVGFVTCENPIMKKWWDESAPKEIIREVVSSDPVYTVTFDMNGGQYVDSTTNEGGAADAAPVTQKVIAGSKVADPGLVNKTGGFLAGWATSGGQLWNFAVNTVTSDKVDSAGNMKLTAQWDTSGHTVKFDLNLNPELLPGLVIDDISYQPVDENIASGARAAEPLEFGLVNKSSRSAPYDGDYIFHGWYTEAACTTLWNFNDNLVTGDITLYAGWSKLPSEPGNGAPEDVVYAILWEAGDASGAPPSQYLYAGANIAAPLPITRPGYAFGGWYTNSVFSGNAWDFAANIVDDNAWNNTYDAKGRKIIELYAKWIPGRITVRFESNGGTYVDSINGNGSPVDQKAVLNGRISDPGLVQLSGSNLGGWYTKSGLNWNFATQTITDVIVSKDVDSSDVLTLTAKWETSGFTVTFDLNIDSDDELKVEDISYEPVPEKIASGARAAEPLGFGSNKKEYSFRGWYKEPACTTLWRFHEDTVTGDITLYAGWAVNGIPKVPEPGPEPEPAKQVYAVHWVDNAESVEDLADQYLLEGALVVAPKVITRPGYAFGGWYIDSGFSGEPWDFTTGKVESIPVSKTEEGNIKVVNLYAEWVFTELNVDFVTNGGTYVDFTPPVDSAPPRQKIDMGWKISNPGLVTKDSSYLAGWDTKIYSNDGSEVSPGPRWNFDDVITKDVTKYVDPATGVMTLYANWAATGYRVTFELNIDSFDDPAITEDSVTYTPADELIADGSPATVPMDFGLKNPDSNHGFIGWHNKNDSNTKSLWDFSVPLTADNTVGGVLTLVAQWKRPPDPGYVVQWDTGNAYYNPMPQYLQEGARIAAPAIITNPGHAFAGWYTDRAFTKPWDFSVNTVNTSYSNGIDARKRKIITLYAKWVVPDMVFVQSGSYRMGYREGETYPNTSPQPTVSISSFYISPTETTNRKYKEVMETSPARWTGEDNPVERVTWYDAVAFCNALSEKEGLKQYYDITEIVYGNYSGNRFIKSAVVKVSTEAVGAFNDGYRLPTEAEWEYAARGGGMSGDYIYAGSNNVDDVAWYDRNSGSTTHPVKTKLPNELGLYDMSGNVSEWCWDWYDSTYYKSYVGVTDPVNSSLPEGDRKEKVRRGGNWNMIDVKTRSRTNTNPGTFSWIPSPADDDLQRFWTIGFRVVRSLRPAN